MMYKSENAAESLLPVEKHHAWKTGTTFNKRLKIFAYVHRKKR